MLDRTMGKNRARIKILLRDQLCPSYLTLKVNLGSLQTLHIKAISLLSLIKIGQTRIFHEDILWPRTWKLVKCYFIPITYGWILEEGNNGPKLDCKNISYDRQISPLKLEMLMLKVTANPKITHKDSFVKREILVERAKVGGSMVGKVQYTNVW